jgi:DNA-binding IclR family transcriptional regulator
VAGGSRTEGQTVASKVALILAVLGAQRQPLRASEVCRRSGMPFSTVHRLLAELAADGLLDRSPDGAYSVGIRLWELSAGHPRVRALRAAAMPAMCRLHATLPATIYLNLLVGREGLCVEELRGAAAVGPGRRGSRFPLRAVAGGQVLLAYAEMRMLQRALAGPPALDGDGGRPPSGRRLGQLLRIQRLGVAVAVQDGRLSVAAPIFESPGAATASLEAVAAAGTDRERMVRAVRDAAAEAATGMTSAGVPSAGMASAGALSGAWRRPA